MKRGLVEWDAGEVARERLAARIARLQEQQAAADLDAALAYTSVAAPQTVRYLTHFLPYWNQGLLVVPRDGTPVLLVALSNRVVELTPDGVHVYNGGYTEYVARTGHEAPGLHS